MCRRVTSRVAFGKPLAEQGTIRADIAESRMEIEQARLLTLQTAHLMDTAGNKAARGEIAMIKVVVPRAALRVIDRAIQAHGAAGVSRRLSAGRGLGARAHDPPRRRPGRSASRGDREAGTAVRQRIGPSGFVSEREGRTVRSARTLQSSSMDRPAVFVVGSQMMPG